MCPWCGRLSASCSGERAVACKSSLLKRVQPAALWDGPHPRRQHVPAHLRCCQRAQAELFKACVPAHGLPLCWHLPAGIVRRQRRASPLLPHRCPAPNACVSHADLCPHGCRPGLQERARYYAVVYLNQILLSHKQVAQPTAGEHHAPLLVSASWIRAPHLPLGGQRVLSP